MSNNAKFKVGDRVFRTRYLNAFPYGTNPLVVHKVDIEGNISFKDEPDDCLWDYSFFELYQPEQPEVKPQVQPMQPLVSIYDKALDLRFEHDNLGDVSLREYIASVIVSLFGVHSVEEDYPDWDYPVFVTLIKAGYIEGVVTPEGYLHDFDFDKAMEFVSKMIAHAFGCTFNKE